MNSITVHAASSKLNPYNISIETTDIISPAMLHTTARLLEGLACTGYPRPHHQHRQRPHQRRRILMSDKKPFWEGKTCNEMAGLHVKVTFKDGSIFTGKTNPDADIVVNYLTVRLSYGAGDDPFLPIRGIDTIELLDDPEYERIEGIYRIDTGDVVVCRSGNKYPVVGSTTHELRIEVENYGDVFISREDALFGLRRKPKLPDDSHVESYFVVEGLGNSNLITQAYDTYEEAFNSIKYLGPGRYEINKRFRVTKEAEV